MALYGGPTPKRHLCICNSRHIQELDRGKLRDWKAKVKELEESGSRPKPLVKTYVDRHGKKRWHGTADLKSSESGSQYMYVNHHTSKSLVLTC